MANYTAGDYYPTTYFTTTTANTLGSLWSQQITTGVWNTWSTATTALPTYYPTSYWDNSPTYATTTYVLPIGGQRYEIPPPTPEEIAVQAERRRVAAAQREEALARERTVREAAVARAETTLHENLTVRQRRSLARRGTFRVRTRSGRCYEIGHADMYELDGRNRRSHHLCVYPVGGLPAADVMLAKKLWLEANEEGIRRVANFTTV